MKGIHKTLFYIYICFCFEKMHERMSAKRAEEAVLFNSGLSG